MVNFFRDFRYNVSDRRGAVIRQPIEPIRQMSPVSPGSPVYPPRPIPNYGFGREQTIPPIGFHRAQR